MLAASESRTCGNFRSQQYFVALWFGSHIYDVTTFLQRRAVHLIYIWIHITQRIVSLLLIFKMNEKKNVVNLCNLTEDLKFTKNHIVFFLFFLSYVMMLVCCLFKKFNMLCQAICGCQVHFVQWSSCGQKLHKAIAYLLFNAF